MTANKTTPPRVKEAYQKEVVPRLMKERSYKSVMAVPRLLKVVVNMGVGEATQNIKLLDTAMEELGRITGQRPAMRRSRKSIAAFKLRAGMPIAATVTLRGDRMYEFCDRLFNVALPRVRDFRGVATSAFDGRGNYTLGLSASRSSRCAPTPGAACAAGPAPTCASSRCAGSASGSWPWRARFPA